MRACFVDNPPKTSYACPESYALCVVALSGQDDDINAKHSSENSMFVFDIGTRVAPLASWLESIELSRSGALAARAGDIQLEMQEKDWRTLKAIADYVGTRVVMIKANYCARDRTNLAQ